MSKSFTILLIVLLILIGTAVLLGNYSGASGWVWTISNQGQWFLPLLAVSAIIDSINPCAFGILILTIAFLFSIGKNRLGILKIGGVYILGLFAAYLLIGLGILQALHLFNTPHFMGKVGAILLIVLAGINLINEFFPSFPIKLRIPHAAHSKIAELMEKASLPTAFILGGLVGLCEFPCTGGPYLMVLGLLHDRGTYLSGVGYLLLYNLIFVLPLVIIMLVASNKILLEKVNNWKKAETKHMRVLGSLAMIVLGIIIYYL